MFRLKVSDWIQAYRSSGDIITGFVTEISNETMTVFVTIPADVGEMKIRRASAWLAEENTQMQDIPLLLDLALLTKDKEWFEKLKSELSLREQWIRYHATT